MNTVFQIIREAGLSELQTLLRKCPRALLELDVNGTTPLQVSLMTSERDWRVVKCLLDAGSDPNDSGLTRCPPLCCATGLQTDATVESYPEIAKLLIGAGARLEDRQKDGWTALIFALMARSEVEVHTLLELGADPSVRVPKDTMPTFVAGLTGLEISLLFEDEANLRALLLAGGNPGERDAFGRDLLEYARERLAHKGSGADQVVLQNMIFLIQGRQTG